MKPASTSSMPRSEATHYGLLGRIAVCATHGSVGFANAANAICQVTGHAESQALARELLTDLAIRGWIALCRQQRDGSDAPIEWRHYELELSDDRNWVDERAGERGLRYALTERGRDKVVELFGPAERRPQPTAPGGPTNPESTSEPNRAPSGQRSLPDRRPIIRQSSSASHRRSMAQEPRAQSAAVLTNALSILGCRLTADASWLRKPVGHIPGRATGKVKRRLARRLSAGSASIGSREGLT
jgi:hypothetical protein